MWRLGPERGGWRCPGYSCNKMTDIIRRCVLDRLLYGFVHYELSFDHANMVRSKVVLKSIVYPACPLVQSIAQIDPCCSLAIYAMMLYMK